MRRLNNVVNFFQILVIRVNARTNYNEAYMKDIMEDKSINRPANVNCKKS